MAKHYVKRTGKYRLFINGEPTEFVILLGKSESFEFKKVGEAW